jgi:hypothetical protein
MRPDEMSPSLERFARDVAPRLRVRFGGPHDRHIDLLAGHLQQGENLGT